MIPRVKIGQWVLWTVMSVQVLHCSGSQVDYIAANLDILYTVKDNFPSENDPKDFSLNSLTLTNTGGTSITGDPDPWWLYFCHIRLVHGTADNSGGVPLGNSKLRVYHVNGCLHKIGPDMDFTLGANANTEVDLYSQWWQVSKTDIMPNWYVTSDGASPQIVQSTAEGSQMIAEFTEAKQYKRAQDDQYSPYAPQDRYELYEDVEDYGSARHNILPTPVEEVEVEGQSPVQITTEWVVYYDSADGLEAEADFLAEALNGLTVVTVKPASKFIELSTGAVTDKEDAMVGDPEAYNLVVSEATDSITITGITSDGVFWGVQSLLSICGADGAEGPDCEIPAIRVTDYPRLPFRGMHLDVGRNFHTKEDVFRLLDVMSMYKLNKFHFHLTEDEGWRLEIDGLEELTDIGAKRCHDGWQTTGADQACILPQLGSDPVSNAPGSGYYTKAEYIEILEYAVARHIEVIPEADMPGHAHAAIQAMEARYRKHEAEGDMAKAEEYLLSDLNDTSKYLSEQLFTDSAINPCINSTYTFVAKVVKEIKALHQGIQPLKIFHFGGDEVPHGAWMSSPACQHMVNDTDLMKHFVVKVAEVVAGEGLDMAGWEDGLIDSESGEAYEITDLPAGREYYAHAWSNIWEWGNGQRAYKLANAGYKTIISHATHFYFDHPYEPDPEERGYYWAPRFTDARKTFGYVVDDVYENIDTSRRGEELDREEICDDHGCEELAADKKGNIIGIQGQLWSETVRTSEQLDYMIFPRMLALAERAWHEAEWEENEDNRDEMTAADWQNFANTIGYKELARLEKMGVKYGLPPPGATVSKDFEMVANSAIPGLSIIFSDGNTASWTDYTGKTVVAPGATIQLKTMSRDKARESRVVTVGVSTSGVGSIWSTRSFCVILILLSLSVGLSAA